MYKALTELSVDRIDFISRLFGRPRPPGVKQDCTAQELLDAFVGVPADPEWSFASTRTAIEQLEIAHGFALGLADKKVIVDIGGSFHQAGPALRGEYPGTFAPTYAELLAHPDRTSRNFSYIASEQQFKLLKTYHKNNLIVPLVGSLEGDKTLREVGRYLKEHKSTVMAFYTSNVEQYLFQSENAWRRFCSNVSRASSQEAQHNNPRLLWHGPTNIGIDTTDPRTA